MATAKVGPARVRIPTTAGMHIRGLQDRMATAATGGMQVGVAATAGMQDGMPTAAGMQDGLATTVGVRVGAAKVGPTAPN